MNMQLLKMGPEMNNAGEPIIVELLITDDLDTINRLIDSLTRSLDMTDKCWCYTYPRDIAWQILEISKETTETSYYGFKIIPV